MRTIRKIIQIDEEKCDGCGQCVISCAEGALEIIDGKAKVISDNLCDGLGACIGECPQDALKIIEREAEEFDEEAVEDHLSKTKKKKEATSTMACGCPSTHIESFVSTDSCQKADGLIELGVKSCSDVRSALSHWPVQIRLIPSTAPFLKGADLLIVADCVPVAFPGLHQSFLKGRVVMIGCPKFDDVEKYLDKFSAIFKTAGIKSISTIVMEVPCCSSLLAMVTKGLQLSGRSIPVTQYTISTKGEIIDRCKVA
jgi:NAD-dependent dihydropyrimidine dehydrogenase PreA subunit